MDIFEGKAIKPMLIAEQQEPFDSEDWLYELKWDGVRCISFLNNTETDLRNKRSMRLLSKFPELAQINEQINSKCILDGEIAVLKHGVPDFYEVQKRTILTDPFKIELAYTQYPASFIAFDIIYYKGKDITKLPLLERKMLLNEVVKENSRIAVSRYIENKGIDLYKLADAKKLEGVVAKKKDSKYYYDKRSKDWIKFKRMSDEDYIICGYVRKGTRNNTLILGQYREDRLVYKGSVSFGVKLDFLQEYKLNRLDYSPFTLTPSGNDDVIWLEPILVCTVEYMPNTKNALRQAVYKGIRDDVVARECQVKT